MERDGSEMTCVGAHTVHAKDAAIRKRQCETRQEVTSIIFRRSALRSLARSQSRAGAVFRIAKRSGSFNGKVRKESQPSRKIQRNSILLTPNGHETLKPLLRFAVVVVCCCLAPAYRLDMQSAAVSDGPRRESQYVDRDAYARTKVI